MIRLAVKIAHCGDLHIGAELSTLGEKAARRRSELLLTLERICDFCDQNETEVLLVAGDLFDSCRVDDETVSSVVRYFSRLAKTRVFIVPGNHDFLTAGSPFDREWSQNVHIFREGGYVETESYRVYGIPFLSAYCEETELPVACHDGKTNILLIHADMDGGPYNPVTEGKIADTEMDYVALGHIHGFSGVLSARGVSFAYCGCPEPLGFDETGEKGIIAGTLDPLKNDLSFVKTCSREYREISLSTDGISDMGGLIAAAQDAVLGNDKNFIKLILSGECSFSPDLSYIKSSLENEVYHLKVKNLTRPAENLELLRKEQTLKGIFTNRMLNLIENSDGKDREVAERALALGLAAFDGREVSFSDN